MPTTEVEAELAKRVVLIIPVVAVLPIAIIPIIPIVPIVSVIVGEREPESINHGGQPTGVRGITARHKARMANAESEHERLL